MESKGWLSDILTCVRELSRKFVLTDIYAFEGRLAALHPGNWHAGVKIRQQLRVDSAGKMKAIAVVERR